MAKNDNDLIFDKNENSMKTAMSKLFTQQLKVPVSSHDFRHTKITELAESGMQIAKIQKHVGHKSATTTLKYVTVD